MSNKLYVLVVILTVFIAVGTIFLSSVKENNSLKQVRFTSVYADEFDN